MDLQEPVIIIEDPVVLQENLQDLIPTMSLVKKVIETSQGNRPIPYPVVNMTIAADIRGANLRHNLCVVFETFPDIPLHYLFSVIDPSNEPRASLFENGSCRYSW
jgi:hypothetical protein